MKAFRKTAFVALVVMAIATNLRVAADWGEGDQAQATGYNAYGQLGDGTTTNRSTPVVVLGLTDSPTAIAGGVSHSLALEGDGTVWAWGRNNYGQLGDETTTTRLTPVQVSDLTSVYWIAAGLSYSLALKSNGTVWAWGSNAYGQLGDGTTTTRYAPVQVSGLTGVGVSAIAAGPDHSLFVSRWLYGIMPPTPDPMTFAAAPAPTSISAITMTATTATDADSPPVSYYFNLVSGGSGGNDSTYQSSEIYTDSGLTANTAYTYRVKARDSATPLPNETAYSDNAPTATFIETPTGVSFGTVTTSSIVLNATGTLTNLDIGTSGVYFDSTTSGGDGGINAWVQLTTETATGLSPDKSYTFRVKARNQNSVETAYSPTAAKVTLANVPAAPSLGSPTTSTMTLDVNPNGNPAVTVFAVRCTATVPTDAAWLNKFISATGTPSATAVWQTDSAWGVITVSGLQPATTYTFAVQARNQEGVETAFGFGASLATSAQAGACCYDAAPCAVVTETACTTGGGAYQGVGTTCTLHLCCPLMGDMNGNGVVDGADVQGFVSAMLTGFDPCADLAAPYDTLDPADTSAFVALMLSP